MAKVTKKWCKEFAKRYTDALNQIRILDKVCFLDYNSPRRFIGYENLFNMFLPKIYNYQLVKPNENADIIVADTNIFFGLFGTSTIA